MNLSHPAMARRPFGGNLHGMYTTAAPFVRDEPAAYGPHEVEADAFPAAAVLEDLRRAPEHDVPRILARYAALRSWLLRGRTDPGLTRHAARTARRYLAAVADWPEAAHLARLADPEPALSAVRDAAVAAAGAGHVEGAYALFRAGYMAARRRGELAWAARLAAGIVELLEREDMDGAALWARRADRLGRRADHH